LGVSPDGGNGLFELLIIVVLVAAVTFSIRRARRKRG
jgi:preprotein translocase subunit YajC